MSSQLNEPTEKQIREDGAIPSLDQILRSQRDATLPVEWKGPFVFADASGITDWTPWQIAGCVRRMGNLLEMWNGTAWIPMAGGLTYKGGWDAAANAPPLASGVGARGNYYVVTTPGGTNLDGITDWVAGDWAIFNGTAWQKIDNTDKVASVFTRMGAVAAAASDYDASQVDNDSGVAGTYVSNALDRLQDHHTESYHANLPAQTDESEVSAALNGSASKRFIPTHVVIKVVSASGVVAGDGTINVGTATDGSDLLSAAALTSLAAAGDVRIIPLPAMTKAILGNATLYANVEAADSTATTLVLDVWVLGREF